MLLSPLSCCEHKSGRRCVRNGPFGWVGARGGQEKGAGRALGSTRTRFDSTPLICFPMIRYVVRERVVRIRRAQQRLRKGRARCLREQRCLRCGVGRGSPGCSTIPSGSARLGSTCPSGYPDRCGRAGQCSDGKFWSGTEPGRAAAQAVSRSGWLRSGGGGTCTRQPVHLVARRTDLRRRHGILLGQEELQLKDAVCTWVEGRGLGYLRARDMRSVRGAGAGQRVRRTLIRRRLRPSNDHVEVSQVVLVRCRTDSWRCRARRAGA